MSSKRSFSAMNGSGAQPQVRSTPAPPSQMQQAPGQSFNQLLSQPSNLPISASSAVTNRTMRLDDIVNDAERKRTLGLLQSIPTLTVQEARDALKKHGGNLVKAQEALWILSKIQRNKNLPMNEFVDPETRMKVRALQGMCPGTSTQDAYVAIKVSDGDLEKAKRHIELVTGTSRPDLDAIYGPI